MTELAARRLSVVELQAAVEAAWRGEFQTVGTTSLSGRRGETNDSADSIRLDGGRPRERFRDDRGSGGGRRRVDAAATPGSVGHFLPGTATPIAAVVLAAHPGAGASTVALALAAAAAEWDVVTQLIECAPQERSGLAAATETELGVSAGWRCGTRGGVTIQRPAAPTASGPPMLPTLRPAARSVLVLDPGLRASEPAMVAPWASELVERAELVLVLRATVPGVRAAEHLVAELDGRLPLIAAVGPARWPGVVVASCGPRLRAAREAARVIPIPIDSHLAVTGLTADPLPKPLLAAARLLARLTFPDIAAA